MSLKCVVTRDSLTERACWHSLRVQMRRFALGSYRPNPVRRSGLGIVRGADSEVLFDYASRQRETNYWVEEVNGWPTTIEGRHAQAQPLLGWELLEGILAPRRVQKCAIKIP